MKSGDKIGIIAPSGIVSGVDALLSAQKYFEEYGFKVKIFPSCHMKETELTDAIRLKDLHDAFFDNEIKMILCARGGYGALRILDEINYELIANHPKIFAGSSDITLLLLNFLAKCGLKTYHSQMALKICQNNMFENLVDTIDGKIKKIALKKDGKILLKGDAKGILWGGNLATIVSLFGSDEANYLPKEDILLFLEDLNEPLYKIDRMLTQIFRHSALRKKIKGLIFGEFSDVERPELEKVLTEFAKKFNVPSFWGYNISHESENIAIPVGASALLQKDGTICIV